MNEDFARLERHSDMQVLCFVAALEKENSYGPCVVTRCNPAGLDISVTTGPFPDTDEGWDAANEAMATKDLAAFADEHSREYAWLTDLLDEETDNG
jgi:hypothetical protein